MNGEFFVLAFTAALNPKLLALDLLLIENRLISAGVDLAVGLVLLALAALLLTGTLPR